MWLARIAAAVALVVTLAACQPDVQSEQTATAVTVVADGSTRQVTTDAALVRDVLGELGLTVGPLDRLTPSEFTPLSNGLTITLVRVTEAFETADVDIPFERQTVRNEGLPEGDTRILQTGAVGSEEVTYRTVFEDGVQVSRSVVRRTVIESPAAEIIMVGAQQSFTTIPIVGRLVYLSAGNAWLMRESSGTRRPLTVSGDLDGRVFALSPDGRYLLFTRSTLPAERVVDVAPPTFNRLWLVETENADASPIDLEIDDVLWADWSPTNPQSFALTTADPSASAPGWRAHNNLLLAQLGDALAVDELTEVIATNDGGEAGYYGTNFVWSPTGDRIGYAQATTLGLIDPATGASELLSEFTRYETYSDWVWNPDFAFSADGRALYTVRHGPPIGLENPEDSPLFDLATLATDGRFALTLHPEVGIWASPVVSPTGNRLAYLQAVSPLESVTARYRLTVADRDGSNPQTLFPAGGASGLRAQHVTWAPDASRIALVWDGNLWVLDPQTGTSQQLTGDGQTSNPVWGP